MKLFFSACIFLLLTACGSNQDVNSYSEYVKIVSNTDSTINELSATSDSMELNRRLNVRFQSFSENKDLISNVPIERIQEKAALWENCKVSFDSCNYVPEGYSFSTKRNFLNLKYQYNGFGSNDLSYKHGVIDLSNAQRLMHSAMYTDPLPVLKMYNTRYVKVYEDYLLQFQGELSQADQDEFDIIRNHLDDRAPFKLSDLDHFELIFDSKKKHFTEIRFHFNGQGGVYKAVLTEGYISFALKELDEFLLKEFKKQLRKG
ncbi:MAG: hypothetical protein P8P74_02095 [Crocinitomicaceae bacterium]|nr:hypothetical protein [Crocinitomicaceae bacterium]